ncbi:6-bladed beta-propeller [Gracilimonas amylolytica]|uniref:6-bladed beta-propeller n=1 Tax=Gracilimonas amylolytica TaxID=1749045 RepID=UPI000CD850FF|nr:6-bladed beta-propeller [Gracilimonas amylolytica]
MSRAFLTVLVILLLSLNDLYGQFFEVTDRLTLEENNEVILGLPRFQERIGNEILVVDQETHRVLVYDKEGKLLTHFGRYGRGPGDLEKPTSVVKLSTGEYLVSEFKGRISKFDATGKFQSVTDTGIPRLNGLKILPNGVVLLIGGMTTPDDHYLLHLFDPLTMEVEKAFFQLPVDPAEYGMQPLTLAESSFAVVCQDKIVASHAMLPKLFYFDFDGEKVSEVQIKSDLFSIMEKHQMSSNPTRMMEIYGSASWLSGLHCLNNGSVLVQFYQNLKMKRNPLVAMLIGKHGNVLNEQTETPDIKFSIRGTDTVYVKDPESDLLNSLLKATVNKD